MTVDVDGWLLGRRVAHGRSADICSGGKVTSVWRQARRQSFNPTENAPAEARRFVSERLSAWGLTAAIEPVVLAVSELVSNAVTHGQGVVGLALHADGDRVHVAIDDEGGGTPLMRQGSQDRLGGGWGLQIVDTIADDWGIVTQEHQTTVWFDRHVRLSPETRATT